MAAALVTCTRGEVATQVRRALSADPGKRSPLAGTRSLNGSDPDQRSDSQCWGVGRQRGVFLVDVNDWDSAARDSLRALGSNGTVATCTRPRGSSCRVKSRLLDLLAAARRRDGRQEERTIANVCAPAQILELWAQWKN